MKNFMLFIVIGIFLTTAIFSLARCKSQKPSSSTANLTSYKNMNNINPYWKEIDSLLKVGLPKSALKRINEIESEVRATNHPGQIAKWVQKKVVSLQVIEENSDYKNYIRYQEEIKKAKTPAKELLSYYLAEYLKQYAQNNNWRIQNRTAVQDAKDNDLRTWSLGKLETEMNRLYQASISNSKLKEYAVSSIEPNLVKGKGTEGLRSSLFDLLAHQVLRYYTTENSFLTEPAYQFYIDESTFFAEAATFSRKDIITKDTASRKLAALKLFQELTNDHLNDISPDALIDLELLRLTFVNQNYVGDDKARLYLEALKRLRKKYPDSPLTAETIYHIALYHRQKAGNFNANNPTDKEENKIALALLQEAVRLYPNTYGAELCANKIKEIKYKYVSVKVEEVYLPKAPGLVHLEYKNITEVKLKIFKLTHPYDIFQLNRQNGWKGKLKREPIAFEETIQLKIDEDYNEHTTELMIPALPFGQYYLLVEAGKGQLEAYVHFQVSNIAATQFDRYSESNSIIQVLDRTEGKIIANAKVNVFRIKGYKEPVYKNPKIVRTDQAGKANIKKTIQKNNTYYLSIEKGEDLLVLSDRRYLNDYHSSKPTRHRVTRFFLDRAIYRPGQTVYFKALVLENDKDRIPTIQKNRNLSIWLTDANGQEVKRMELRTNSFGTVNGSFKLPQSGMNGRFYIHSSDNGGQGFRMEEYKRPRFEVKMNPPKKAYAINDKVVVTGLAKNYSGAPLDGATVKYVINRQTHFPYWKRGWGYWYSPPAPVQIAVGEATTKPDGTFEVNFEALPDRSIDKKTKPNFNFNINVTVIDVTGEVHESSTNVTVGYIALSIQVPLVSEMDVQDFDKLHIISQNLNGEFEAAKGILKISKLQEPKHFFVDRYWEKPEYQLISKAKFNTAFPYFAYEEEDEKEAWPVKSVAVETSFNTQVADSISFGHLPAGYYKVEIFTKDKNGEKIEVTKFIELQDANAAYEGLALFAVKPIKTTGEPGAKMKINLVSADKMNFNITTLRYDKSPVDELLAVNKEQREMTFSITEKDRGGFQATIYAIRHNRFFQEMLGFTVPWSNKELKITYESFREKLYPGQKEKWRIKISGPKADAAAAEVVASLYDASLDAFAANHWQASFYPSRYIRGNWSAIGTFSIYQEGAYFQERHENKFNKVYDRLEESNLFSEGFFGMARGRSSVEFAVSDAAMGASPEAAPSALKKAAPMSIKDKNILQQDGEEDKEKMETPPSPSPRTNLKETVFFKPDLKTDADGNVIIEFTMNEALTKWKLMLFAHDQDLRVAYSTKEVVTQKEIMVIPNPPRFLREFDEIEFSAKVVNMSKEDLRANVELRLLDELNFVPVYKWLDNPQFNKVIHLPKGRSMPVSFRFKVPSASETPLIKWTLTAASRNYSDGESSYLPVVSNRMLVTETMPLPVKAKQSRTFDFKAMAKVSQSNTLENHNYTLEFTANPAWYAVQALPYMMEYPHECSEQIFSRFYANTLASSIANQHPKIKRVFEQWRTEDKDALASNLSKNQELKSALLEETPWVMNALSEEEQKKNIGLLFDLDRMAGEQEKAIRTLAERQSRGGGFPWFPGGRDSWYITQYLVEGFGHLEKLGALKEKEHPKALQISKKAIQYIDNKLLEHYTELEKQVKKGHAKWEDDHLGNMVIHYLYARSFFKGQDMPRNLRKPYDYYLAQAQKYWLGKGLYQEGLIALALQRNDKASVARNIMKSIKERSITNEELGMYWKQASGYYWYQLPVETNALMIEAFEEIMQDKEAVYQLKVWLLKNKQTTHWKTTKATASAVYALLSSGENWLLEDKPIDIKIGQFEVKPDKTQAGTGYFKQSWNKEMITGDMSKITVKNPNNAIAWGAVYWQYFEDLDKVKIFKDTPLQLKKEVYRQTMSDKGPVLNKINEGDVIHVGDKLKMRIELRVDRAMEYVHMKDMRAAGFEPTNVLSRYKWQDGLGYYESTRDLATDFFFSYLRPGVYVFEYPLTAQLKGNFSNGVTTIQCMYAPEFSSHSEGVRVTVE